MSQVPSITIEYEESRATICPPSCDLDNVVSVQLGHSLARSGTLPGRACNPLQQVASGSRAIPPGGSFESPAWPLDVFGPGREMK